MSTLRGHIRSHIFEDVSVLGGTTTSTSTSTTSTSTTTDPFIAQYRTVYDSFTTPPSASVADAQNTMVSSLVSDGIWAKLDVFYLFAQSTNGDSEALKNWKNPGTYDATLGATPPTFTALEGFTGGGVVGSYIDCGYNPTSHAVNYTQNDMCLFCYIRTDVAENKQDAAFGAAPYSIVYPVRTTNKLYGYINSTGALMSANTETDARGFVVNTRSDGVNAEIYKNGSSLVSGALASTGIPNDTLKFCGNVAGGSYSTKQVSCGGCGGHLTDTEVSNLTDAIETYMDSNSKGVIP